MTPVEFIRTVITDKPWETKATTLRNLAQAYRNQINPGSQITDEDLIAIKEAVLELQWRRELRIVAGAGWAAGDVEFLFQAVA